MIYGYCRISTQKQNIERQERNILAEYPDAKIIKEAYTGKTISRPLFDKLLSKVKEGDTIVFDSVSRMSRNAEEGMELYEKLYNEGVNLVFLKEHHIDTDTYRNAISKSIELTGDKKIDCLLKGVNNFLLELRKEQIRLTLEQAQKEVDDLRQRTKEGIETAHINGKESGRKNGTTIETEKAKICKRIIAKHSIAFGGNLRDEELMVLCNNISRNSFYKYKKQVAEVIAKEGKYDR